MARIGKFVVHGSYRKMLPIADNITNSETVTRKSINDIRVHSLQ
jgi:hypothetical protein